MPDNFVDRVRKSVLFPNFFEEAYATNLTPEEIENRRRWMIEDAKEHLTKIYFPPSAPAEEILAEKKPSENTGSSS